MEYVRRRGRNYYAVISVPIDVQEAVGRKQIWRSLKTSCKATARIYARNLIRQADFLFLKVRFGMVDVSMMKSMIAEFALGELEFDDKRSREARLYKAGPVPHPEDGDPDEKFIAYQATESRTEKGRARFVEGLECYIKERQEHLAAGTPEKLGSVVEACSVYMDKYKVSCDQDDITDLLMAFAEAQKLIALIVKERVQGIGEESDLQHRILTKWRANLPVLKDKGIPLAELFHLYLDQWSKEHRASRVLRKAAELKRAQMVFAECFGEIPNVKEVTPEMALEWRGYYQHEYGEPLRNKTVNNATTTLSAVFNYALQHRNKYAEENPFRGVQLPEGIKSEKSRIFTAPELQAYINLLAQFHDNARPEMTWIPLVMAFSGMRCNEVAQLFIDDVVIEDGVQAFRVTDNEERRQHLKTEESRRSVPIHQTLVGLGFLRYLEKQRNRGGRQLWPSLRYREQSGGYYDANVSSRMNLPVNLISTDRKLRVYSLRANFRCSIEEAIIAPVLAAHDRGEPVAGEGYSPFLRLALDNIMGHKVTGGTGDVVYRKRQLQIMQKVVQMAAYQVDLSAVKAVLSR